jgi:hypothetical protein
MMDDSGRRRARDLADALQLAVLVGVLIDLGLPWWRHVTAEGERVTWTGWNALGSDEAGYPWLLIGVVGLGAAAVVLDRPWVRRTTAWIALLVALGIWMGVARTNSLDDFGALPGAWTGVLLLFCCAAAQWWAVLASYAGGRSGAGVARDRISA